MKDNKFINFIKNNDITKSNQGYVMTKILCNKNSQDSNKKPYLWFKLLSIQKFNKEGQEVQQIYILDYFTYDLEKYNNLAIGSFVNYEVSQMIGRKCQIVSLSEVE